MPRQADPLVEERILSAARRLWTRGGDRALSMRAVAKAARTNTPAIYRRFRNRKDILRALVLRAQQELFETLQPCQSLEEAAQQTLGFALTHSHEYELLTSGLFARIQLPRPNFEFMKQRCAEWLGGSPEDYAPLVLALWSIIHGTAMLIISGSIPVGNEDKLRAAFTKAVRVLVQNTSTLSRQK
jgi:AcrR family transcriptional regulator